jgi:hypothetical protein
MRYTPFVAAALLFSAACSNDQREASFVSEAQAASAKQQDYGWQTQPNFAAPENGAVYEYN